MAASEDEVKVDVAMDDYPTVSTNPSQPAAFEPPPKYEGQATASPPAYTTDSPPDYDSVFGKVRRVKDESDGNVDFGCKMFALLCCNTVIVIITIVLCFSIPIASIVIGALNLKDCAIERYIPIYLIVSGVFGVIKACIDSGVRFKEKKQRDNGEAGEEDQRKPNPLSSIINCFLFAWFIAGSVWVYRIYGDVEYEDMSSHMYCDKMTYLFAFATITVVYSLMALGLLCCCCVCAVMCCCMAGKD